MTEEKNPNETVPAAAITESPSLLRASGIEKHFTDPERGQITALENISFSRSHGISALLGANGAGKSTLMRCIATLMKADAGDLFINEIDVRKDPEQARAQIGYLSMQTRIYPRLSCMEMLRYAASFYEMKESLLEQRLEEMIEIFKLQDFLHQRCESLSSGQNQRVNLARTLIADPPVLILDEPTTGLDIIASADLIDAVSAMRSEKRLIIMSTHHLHEVDELADHVLVLHEGKLIVDQAKNELGSGNDFRRFIHQHIRCVSEPEIESVGGQA